MHDNDVPEFDPQHDRVLWVACFDLLGMRARIARGDHLGVCEACQQVLEHLAARAGNAEQQG